MSLQCLQSSFDSIRPMVWEEMSFEEFQDGHHDGHLGYFSNSDSLYGQQHLLQWLHKKCSGLERLTKDPDYRCTRCQGTACPLDGRPQKEVQVGPDKLEVVASFCYLGDMLSAAGGCELSTTTRGRSSRTCYQFSLHTISLSKHLAVCTALVCGAQCSMLARLGH